MFRLQTGGPMRIPCDSRSTPGAPAALRDRGIRVHQRDRPATCTWIGPRPMTCDIDFLGMTLSTQAAGWLAAGIGGVLGTALALILTGETARWTWLGIRRWIARAALAIVRMTLLVVGGIAALSRLDRDVPPGSQDPAQRT